MLRRYRLELTANSNPDTFPDLLRAGAPDTHTDGFSNPTTDRQPQSGADGASRPDSDALGRDRDGDARA
jgi:hypothetical protein